jgi:hypothetical protein
MPALFPNTRRMKPRLQASTRIISLVSAILLGIVIFLPIWRIDLTAPQYPEGLYMQIYANKLGGDVDVINGLNHYIGMNHIHEKDFIEFKVLPAIILTLAGFGILTVIINRRWFYNTWFGCLLAFGVIAMIDFYQWLYNYGHNLDPAAAIKVPGQSYQPPLIGYKQLLNFGAYSMPDSGGWLFIAAGVLMLIGLVIEIRKAKTAVKKTLSSRPAGLALLFQRPQTHTLWKTILRPLQNDFDGSAVRNRIGVRQGEGLFFRRHELSGRLYKNCTTGQFGCLQSVYDRLP